MTIKEIETPAILVRKNAMEQNLRKYQAECDKYNKALWPMVKTHKSTELCMMQKELGADGFLCGTLDECETLCKMGMENIMYAYPLAGEISCRRAAKLAKQCAFYARIDGLDAAMMLNAAAGEEDVIINYTIIIDCGLHRFGVAPEAAVSLAKQLRSFSHLHFVGISSHSGHVYGEADPDKVPSYALDEKTALHTAAAALTADGFDVQLVTTGSTPTFWGNVDDELINIYHPGNYIFNDCIQLGNHTATEDECALVIYATVISHPRDDLFICDAGAKCLGLDQGAHGNSSVIGHGRIIGHPELVVYSLSEEVGKIHAEESTDLKVGDRIMIIPNHSCSAANLTDYYILVDEKETVERLVTVDIRGNKTTKCSQADIRNPLQDLPDSVK